MATKEDLLGPVKYDWSRDVAGTTLHGPTIQETHQKDGLFWNPKEPAPPPTEEQALLQQGVPPEDVFALKLSEWLWDEMKRAESKAFAPELNDSQRNQLIGIRNAHADTLRKLGQDPLRGRPRYSPPGVGVMTDGEI